MRWDHRYATPSLNEGVTFLIMNMGTIIGDHALFWGLLLGTMHYFWGPCIILGTIMVPNLGAIFSGAHIKIPTLFIWCINMNHERNSVGILSWQLSSPLVGAANARPSANGWSTGRRPRRWPEFVNSFGHGRGERSKAQVCIFAINCKDAPCACIPSRNE